MKLYPQGFVTGAVVLCLPLLLGIAGCGAAYHYGAEGARDYVRAPSAPGKFDQAASRNTEDASGYLEGKPERIADAGKASEIVRQIVYTAWFTVAVYDLDAARKKLVEFAESYGGYLQSRNGQTLVIRVPGEHFAAIQPYLEKLGKVDHDRTDIRAEDVTEAFMDMQLRLRTKKQYLESLNGLLTQAGKLEEKLAVQREIGRVVEEIEAIEGKLRLLKSRIAFATATVSLKPAYTGPTRTFRLPWGWLDTLGVEYLVR